MDQGLRILVVAGHPADAFNHCGGTLAHHVRRGDAVTILVLTHGLRVHDVVVAEELRFRERSPEREELERIMQEQGKVKHRELIEALDILGVTDVRFVDHDDSILLVSRKLIEEVAKVIRQVRPQVVITHYPLLQGGVGSHHGNVGKIVLYAEQSAANVSASDSANSSADESADGSANSPGDDPHPGWRVAQTFFMSPEDATFRSSVLCESRAYCDYYVDVTDVIELKLRAYDRLRSNQYGGAYSRRSVENWTGKDGFWMKVPYAEGFMRYQPEIGEFLTVSDELIERANEPESEMHARMDRMIVPFLDLPDE